MKYKAEREIMRAVESGVNYFDTAYAYPGSEECLGRILAENKVRDKVNIATKLPQYMVRSMKAVDKIFREELSRLRTDHVDYYLMHMFTDISEWERLKSYGMEEWIAARKAEGSIRQIGFSYHGDTEMFLQILDAYDWDFCQVQYNYLDETSQAGRSGVEAAEKKGIPVVIMEPLRGGKLVNLPVKAKRELADSGKRYTATELGLRWLWNQTGVTVVLSGMNSLEMVDENIRIASDAEPGRFDESDFALINSVRKIIREKERVGCTGCRYCMPCPSGVDIPGNFYHWNLMYIEGKKNPVRFEFARNVGLQANPGFASQITLTRMHSTGFRSSGSRTSSQRKTLTGPLQKQLKRRKRTSLRWSSLHMKRDFACSACTWALTMTSRQQWIRCMRTWQSKGIGSI